MKYDYNILEHGKSLRDLSLKAAVNLNHYARRIGDLNIQSTIELADLLMHLAEKSKEKRLDRLTSSALEMALTNNAPDASYDKLDLYQELTIFAHELRTRNINRLSYLTDVCFDINKCMRREADPVLNAANKILENARNN
ncbi:hypothetical protein JXB27_01670 [Candidatus Woesearchaeota archaeon]|nr:hypothetical protein [Candidatus Woesearchaeota archaeon]